MRRIAWTTFPLNWAAPVGVISVRGRLIFAHVLFFTVVAPEHVYPGSTLQVEEQPSPSRILLSSQSS